VVAVIVMSGCGTWLQGERSDQTRVVEYVLTFYKGKRPHAAGPYFYRAVSEDGRRKYRHLGVP
jgi:uncharacterized protein YceK